MVGRALLVSNLMAVDQEMHPGWVVPEMHPGWVVPVMQAIWADPIWVDPIWVAAQSALVEGSIALVESIVLLVESTVLLVESTVPLVESTVLLVDSTADHQTVQLVHHLPNQLVNLPDRAVFNWLHRHLNRLLTSYNLGCRLAHNEFQDSLVFVLDLF